MASRYKVEHFFNKFKNILNRSFIIIINDNTIKNYYGFTHIAAAYILLNLSL
jgi:hypothetical protein